MTEEYVGIPVSVFTSEAYQRLSASEKVLLVDLYLQNADVERFTVRPAESIRSAILPRLRRLVDLGILVIDEDRHRGFAGGLLRVYRFAVPALVS